MTMVFSYIVIAAMAVMAVKTMGKYRNGDFHAAESVFWMTLWVAVGVVSLVPETLSFVAGLVGVGRGVDLLTYLAIIVLFYAVFRLYYKTERLNSELTTLVRERAIQRAEDDE